MYLVAVDGRRPGWSAGVTQSEESAFMFYLGAYNAINLDGGGSTALVVEGADGLPQELNRPSGNAERYNGNNFGIYANALPAPVPLPAGVWLLGSGLASLAMAARRRRLAVGSLKDLQVRAGHDGVPSPRGMSAQLCRITIPKIARAIRSSRSTSRIQMTIEVRYLMSGVAATIPG